METPKRRKGGKKRPDSKKPSLDSQPTMPTWLGVPLAEIQPTPAVPFTPFLAITPMPQPEKSISDLLLEVVIEAYKVIWKKASPGSYVLNRAIYEVAPYCRPEASGTLNAGALITFGYGLKQVADNTNRRGH